MLKANYHTHLYLCGHAVGDVKDYVDEAIRLGFDELGISDHAHTPTYFMTNEEYKENLLEEIMSEADLVNIYIPKVMEAKKNPKLKVFLGLETEYIKEYHDYFKSLREKVEYLNLGVHFFKYNGKVYSTYDPITPELAKVYTDVAIDAMSTGLFTTLVHPDLFMMNYVGEKGRRVFDDTAIECSKRLIDAAIKYDMYLEINANGIKKGLFKTDNDDLEYLYPRTEFWKLVSETNAKVIIGADAHEPKALGYHTIPLAERLAKECNIKLETYIKFKEYNK